MSPILSEGSRHYIQARRIHPHDSVSKLGYYLPSTSTSASSLSSSPSTRVSQSPSSSASRSNLLQRIDKRHRASVADYQLTCTRDSKRKTKKNSSSGGSSSSPSTSSSSSYSSKLNRILKFSRDPIRTRSRKDLNPFDDNNREILSSNYHLKNLRERGSEALTNFNEVRGDIESGIKNISPFNSSGFSDGTIIEPSYTENFKKYNFDAGLAEPANNHINHNQKRGLQYSLGTKQVDDEHQNFGANSIVANDSRYEIGIKPNNARIKRRNISRFNRRMLVRGEEHLINQYALSELFSQSEIPGFREIFASDSYLRKFCWIVAFLFMTVLSLNDMTELITEYYEYPITVDYRLRDSARLPFPAVTVCNLNVVRFSALCSGSSTSRFNLTNQIPSELRDKLCGIQVEKKNVTDSDISDINNIGITTTTTTTTTPTATTTTTTATIPTLDITNNATNVSALTNESSGASQSSRPTFNPNLQPSSTRTPNGAASTPFRPTTPGADGVEIGAAITTSSYVGVTRVRIHDSAEHKNNKIITSTSSYNGIKQGLTTSQSSSSNGDLDLGDFSDQAMLIRNNAYRRLDQSRSLLSQSRANIRARHSRSIKLSSEANENDPDFGYNNRPFASGKSRMKIRQRFDSDLQPEQMTTTETPFKTETTSINNKFRQQRQSAPKNNHFKTMNVQVSNKASQNLQLVNAAAGQQPFGTRNGVPVNPSLNPVNAYQNPLLSNLMSTTTTTTSSTVNPTPWISTTTYSPPNLPEDFELTERQERELQENLTNWLAVMYNRDPQLTWSLGHQFDDMILRCSMKSVNCTHQRSFENSFTPTEGNCYTYRSKVRRRNSNNKLKGGIMFEEANLASINHGLELVLNLEKSEYISGSSQVGALVMVNHPNDLGYGASEATFVAPEFTTYIGLKMVNLTRLPAPYPEYCVDSWPAKFADTLTKNSTYSQQACLRICLQKTIQSHCHCQSAFLPIIELDGSLSAYHNNNFLSKLSNNSATFSPRQQQVSSTISNLTQTNSKQIIASQDQQPARIIICDTRKQSTRICVREIMLRAADRVHNCECPPKCHVVKYDKTISMAKWPTREDKVTFDRGKMDVNFQNLAKVIIYFQTMTYDEVTQQAVFNAAKLFSALGGIMGMYVGFSFLSVFEIFEVMSRKMWHHFTVKLSNTSSRLMNCCKTA